MRKQLLQRRVAGTHARSAAATAQAAPPGAGVACGTAAAWQRRHLSGLHKYTYYEVMRHAL